MAALLFVGLFLLVAGLAPYLGADRSDARSEGARDERGSWAAGPDAYLRPRY